MAVIARPSPQLDLTLTLTVLPKPNPPPPLGVLHPKFTGRSGFQAELRRRIDTYSAETGKPRRDGPQLYLKNRHPPHRLHRLPV